MRNYNPPSLIKRLFSDFQWNTINNKILLTFDDGPTPETTETILNELERLKIKSIFFCVGENLLKNQSLTEELIASQHMIGNHTFHHKKINKLSLNSAREEISTVNNLVADRHGYKIKYFRPPHGRFSFQTPKMLQDEKMQNVMWSLLTFDYQNRLNIVKLSLSKLQSNSIIVLHDSLKSKAIIIDAIRLLIDEIQNKGYVIGTPEECLK